MNAQHLSKSEDWGTPPTLIRLERQVLGRIDLDPASSEEWNFTIGAARYIDAATNGLVTAWVPGAPRPNELDANALRPEAGWDMRVHLNPPGDKRGLRVAAFWCALTGYYDLGWVTAACYVGFSLEQMSRLQRVGARFSPCAFPSLIPDERVPYMRTPDVQSSQPGHASFLTLLSRSRIDVERFCDLGSELGEVATPYRRKATRP